MVGRSVSCRDPDEVSEDEDRLLNEDVSYDYSEYSQNENEKGILGIS